MADTQTRLALLRSGTQAPSSRAQVGTVVRWRSRARMPTRRRPSSDQLITVDDSVEDVTRRLLRKPAPALARAFTKRLVPIAQNAYDRWPVATNLSRSLLSVGWEADETTLRFGIRSDADYSTAIHDGRTVDELLRRPVLQAAAQIAADVAKDIGS